MTEHTDIRAKINRIEKLLEQKFGIRQRGLPRGLRKAGRRLPKRLHQDGAMLIEAELLARNPKARHRLGSIPVEDAFYRLQLHLTAIDVADQRKGNLLKLLGSISVNLIAVVVLFLIWLYWRGYI